MLRVLYRRFPNVAIRVLVSVYAVFGLATLVDAGLPPIQEPVATRLGPKAYRDGDVIEITNVTATSAKLEQGDSVTVTGRVRLSSQQAADLCLSHADRGQWARRGRRHRVDARGEGTA
jgi:hypothetical protein